MSRRVVASAGSAALVVLLAATVALVAAPAGAQERPQISLDQAEVAPGQPLLVTITGFTSQQVTVAVCGNLAKRGSSDCNMPSAQSERIRDDEDVTLTQVFAQAPPMPCPCLVLAFSPSSSEFAVAPITLVGHPTGPVVEPELGPLVEVEVDAQRVGGGLLGSVRSSLGGPTRYQVTVGVRNITTEPLANVELNGVARHRLTDAVQLDLARPGVIEPGQTVVQTVEAEVPAPVIGGFTWEVSAYGAGPTVEAASTVTNRPLLLYVFVVVLLVDLVAIAWRLARRRRLRREEALGDERAPETWEEIQAAWDADAGTVAVEELPAPEPLVGASR